MYATEKYIRAEVRDLKDSIKGVASDLGSDIKHLHSLLQQQAVEIAELRKIVEELSEPKSSDFL